MPPENEEEEGEEKIPTKVLEPSLESGIEGRPAGDVESSVNFKTLSVSYFHKDLNELLDKVSEYGVEKWKVLNALLSRYLGADPVELAEITQDWYLKEIQAFRELKEKKGE